MALHGFKGMRDWQMGETKFDEFSDMLQALVAIQLSILREIKQLPKALYLFWGKFHELCLGGGISAN